MVSAVQTIISIIVAMLIQSGISGMVETAPQEAVDDFMAGIAGGNRQVMNQYVDNEYVNFLVNLEGDDQVTDRMADALFRQFSYEIEETTTKDGVAVARVHISTNDFSDVMDSYEKASYRYVMDNLYEDKVANKKKLSAKCLNIYVQQLEKEAGNKPELESDVFIPMINDGYGGWRVMLDDKLMKKFLGELEIPE